MKITLEGAPNLEAARQKRNERIKKKITLRRVMIPVSTRRDRGERSEKNMEKLITIRWISLFNNGGT
jgi:hypothetical protein